MGYSLIWLAIRGRSAVAICQELDLIATGQMTDIPEADIAAANLPDNWFLIVIQRTDRLTAEAVHSRLSIGCELICCEVEEHVMYSAACCWQDGKKIWSVVHEADKGIYHLNVEGSPPPVFDVIQQRLRAEQLQAKFNNDPVDYIWDIPVELAYQLTGYRHDLMISDLDNCLFETLEFRSKPKSWWPF